MQLDTFYNIERLYLINIFYKTIKAVDTCREIQDEYRHMYKKILLLVLLAALSSASNAEPGLWLATDYNYQFSDNWSVRGDNQWRSWDLEKTDFNTLLLRNSIVLRDRLGFGYAFLNRGDFGESDKVRTEHRTFQDFYFGTQQLWSVTAKHRLRSEQRWVDGEFSTRYRWKFAIDYKDWFAYNELFLTSDWFNQNRTKVGYHVTEHISVAGQFINSERNSTQLVLTWTF